ncbi:hydantoinase/oxoprolinase family protein [Enterovirga aerilata]|uniref:Hydantoinase/oxoprolinase family protein n=1 Tax=Enterovirga aerilata TaxID=2730920 RepID=A0A849I2X7_9HYPH|nr:hydantoinase/oxoprolinase family protein [Enterovirga sp. DB1703]NNM74156.1 hydantoinase/oxoprolinase family protein [Enterovirga sp. DB1703]
MSRQVAFDVGGTFTDFALSEAGAVQQTFLKVPTTYPDPAKGVIAGLHQLIDAGWLDPDECDLVLHATTIATNAILERKGARTALITSMGFRDVLIIGRQKRHRTYEVAVNRTKPLLARSDIFEIRERVGADGEIVEPLDEAALDALARRLAEGGYDAVAVCLLHAYANPTHELSVRDALLRHAPYLRISLSHVVSPKIREYERTSTTVADAYVGPAVERYVASLKASLADLGITPSLSIMQSNGGLISTELACRMPIRIVESGPAAGVLLCAAVGRDEGLKNLLTFDMGGTTAKLGAVDDGEPAIVSGFEVDAADYKKGSGLPLNISSIELVEIGAGGGSIAEPLMGLLQVGPQSASSWPGPACYGRGGVRPTVTDANLLLGYLAADGFNNGAMTLDAEASRNAVQLHVASPLGLSVTEAAWGIHALATNNMERALRIISIERGRDPRDYTLIAFGGAGPLHAARLARQASVGRVLVPLGAGVGSALGLLRAAPKLDALTTRILPLVPESAVSMSEVFADLEAKLRSDLRQAHLTAQGSFQRAIYMRYKGQGFELKVSVPDGPIDHSFVAAARDAFQAAYRRIYGTAVPGSEIEAIDWLLVWQADAPGRRASVATHPMDAADPTTREVYFPETDGFVSCRIFSRSALAPGAVFDGPVIVTEPETTTVVLPGDRLEVTRQGNLLITIGAA